ncbi:uncharacterized protein LOC122543995 [Chiloscyllium plagiosum]|uniref:uncharacterized protein LOC122543995 n=1 Tax=Chiloscyllium plagiosum TaxID=36176 RepID=UPI001CB81FB0|nr:uncharacterized protein LOC122543995 [Chiloscyllium plagiosum]
MEVPAGKLKVMEKFFSPRRLGREREEVAQGRSRRPLSSSSSWSSGDEGAGSGVNGSPFSRSCGDVRACSSSPPGGRRVPSRGEGQRAQGPSSLRRARSVEGPALGLKAWGREPGACSSGAAQSQAQAQAQAQAQGSLRGGRQQRRADFSRFLDEITVQLLSPARLDFFNARPRGPPGNGDTEDARPLAAGPASSLETSTGPGAYTHCTESGRSPQHGDGDEEEEEAEASPWAVEGKARGGGVHKELLVDANHLKSLQEENENLQRHLLHATYQMERMDMDFKASHGHLESELQRARVDMEDLREKFWRLQENYFSTQQAKEFMEEKLCTICSDSVNTSIVLDFYSQTLEDQKD